MATVTHYECPHCGTATSKMEVVSQGYIPTGEERQSRPGMDAVGGEVLKCRCGQHLTWYTVRELVHAKAYSFTFALKPCNVAALKALYESARRRAGLSPHLSVQDRLNRMWPTTGGTP